MEDFRRQRTQPCVSVKFLSKKLGPYRVVRKISSVNYLIEIDGKTKIFHIDNLFKCYQRDKAQTDRKTHRTGEIVPESTEFDNSPVDSQFDQSTRVERSMEFSSELGQNSPNELSTVRIIIYPFYCVLLHITPERPLLCRRSAFV